MQVPFEGFVIPPLFHVVVLVVATVAVLVILYSLNPPVTQWTALAFAPWMVSGATLHVFYQLGERFQVRLYPPMLEPLFSAPAVYVTTFAIMGAMWVLATVLGRSTESVAESGDDVARYLGVIGVGTMLTLVGLALYQAFDPLIDPKPVFPMVGLLLSCVVTFVIYILIGMWRTYVIAEARYVGALVLFAHVFDGITTTIGVDILGSGERSALPAAIMEFAAGLPTAELLGTGWLFLLVKILVASVIIVVFADYVREEPVSGNLLFAFVAAVGLGPAVNNFLLFTLGLA